jgi:hypothetical protein
MYALQSRIDVKRFPDEDFDNLMGESSGAAKVKAHELLHMSYTKRGIY